MYKFMLIQILILLVLQYNEIILSRFIYLQQKDIAKKVNLIAVAEGYKKQQ